MFVVCFVLSHLRIYVGAQTWGHRMNYDANSCVFACSYEKLCNPFLYVGHFVRIQIFEYRPYAYTP